MALNFNMEDVTGSDSTERQCVPCSQMNKSSPASVYCRTCKQFQCAACTLYHKTVPIMTGHEIIEAKEATLYNLDQEFDMNGHDVCFEHNKMLEFLCEDHDLLCCSTCAIVGHRLCRSILEIKKVSLSSHVGQKPIDVLIQKLNENTIQAESLLEHFEATKKSTKTQAKSLKTAFSDMEEKAIALIKKSKEMLSSELAKTEKDLIGKLENNERIVKSAKQASVEAIKQSEKCKTTASPLQQYIWCHRMKRHKIPETVSLLQTFEGEKFKVQLILAVDKHFEALLSSENGLARVDLKEVKLQTDSETTWFSDVEEFEDEYTCTYKSLETRHTYREIETEDEMKHAYSKRSTKKNLSGRRKTYSDYKKVPIV